MKPEPPSHADAATASLARRDWIAGLQNGLAIIETFDYSNPRLTAAQAGQRTGLTRTAARRHLLTLASLGFVATDGKMFWLTPSVLRLGQCYLESARLPRIVQPFLQRVTAGTHVAAWDGRDSGGKRLAGGVYFVRFESAGVAQVGKLVLFK